MEEVLIVTSEQLYRWYCCLDGKVPRSVPEGPRSYRLVGEELRELYLQALNEEAREPLHQVKWEANLIASEHDPRPRAGRMTVTSSGMQPGATCMLFEGVTSEQADAVRFAVQRGARFELHLSVSEDPLRAEVDALKARLRELEAKLA